MPLSRVIALTSLTMLAFAGNSLLCRIALTRSGIDAASFAAIRLISGAIMLWLVVRLRRRSWVGGGNWWSALALFAYAACFSYAYASLPTATGALLLFGAVQATMIGYGIRTGERLRMVQILGLALALIGLVGLLLPGISAPSVSGSILMLSAGAAWGVYSLRGRSASDPMQVTAGNFLRAVPFALALIVATLRGVTLDATGIGYAVASGALASGLGYIIWYTVLPSIKATSAATVQLSVPVIAAAGGIVFLGEPVTVRLALTSIAILGGIALVTTQVKRAHTEGRSIHSVDERD
ncbi:MAG: DMT family transporter [Casimicrobiaceae bacterium]